VDRDLKFYRRGVRWPCLGKSGVLRNAGGDSRGGRHRAFHRVPHVSGGSWRLTGRRLPCPLILQGPDESGPGEVWILLQRKGLSAQCRTCGYSIVRDLERAKSASSHQKAAPEENGRRKARRTPEQSRTDSRELAVVQFHRPIQQAPQLRAAARFDDACHPQGSIFGRLECHRIVGCTAVFPGLLVQDADGTARLLGNVTLRRTASGLPCRAVAIASLR
jgi:hypothetical protein